MQSASMSLTTLLTPWIGESHDHDRLGSAITPTWADGAVTDEIGGR